MKIDTDFIEHVAKALCKDACQEWKSGTWRVLSGTDTVNNKMFWEDHDLDKYNNHWRQKAYYIIRVVKDYENGLRD